MAELPEHRLTVEIEKTGYRTDKILRYSLTSNYLTPTDSFEFTIYDKGDPRALRRLWQPLQRVTLYIDGVQQLQGRIDETQGNDDGSLTVKGLDHRADIVAGGADPSITFKANQDLGDALLMLFKPFGIRTLSGDSNLSRNLLTGVNPYKGGPDRSYKAARLTDFKVEENQGTWEIAEEIVSRHGFTLQSVVGDRTWLAVVEPNYKQDVTYRLERPGNLLEGSKASRDYADVPTVTIATGWAVGNQPGLQINPMLGQYPTFGELAINPIGKNQEVERAASPENGGDELQSRRVDWKKVQSEAEDFVLYRPLFYKDKKSRSIQQMERLIKKDLSRRLKETLVYTARIRGHRDPVSRAIYAIDTMAHVSDDTEDVSEDLWVLEREFTNDGSGPRTTLQLIRPGSITL